MPRNDLGTAMRRKLHPTLTATLIAISCLIAYFTVNGFAESSTQTKPHVFTDAECLRCHNDPASIRKMQEKAGNPHLYEHALELLEKDRRARKATTEVRTVAWPKSHY